MRFWSGEIHLEDSCFSWKDALYSGPSCGTVASTLQLSNRQNCKLNVEITPTFSSKPKATGELIMLFDSYLSGMLSC